MILMVMIITLCTYLNKFIVRTYLTFNFLVLVMSSTKKFLLNGKLYCASDYINAYNNMGRDKPVNYGSSSYDSCLYGSTSSYGSTSYSSGHQLPFNINNIGASFILTSSKNLDH